MGAKKGDKVVYKNAKDPSMEGLEGVVLRTYTATTRSGRKFGLARVRVTKSPEGCKVAVGHSVVLRTG